MGWFAEILIVEGEGQRVEGKKGGNRVKRELGRVHRGGQGRQTF